MGCLRHEERAELLTPVIKLTTQWDITHFKQLKEPEFQ